MCIILYLEGGDTMEKVKFSIKKGDESYGIQLYRGYDNDNSVRWGYIDTFSPMSLHELQELNKFLSSFIWQVFTEGKDG